MLLAPRDSDLRKRCLKAFCQFDRIVVGPEVDKKETWLFIEHVIVDSGHLNAVLAQGSNHRIKFRGGHYEVAGYCRLVTAGRLEVDPDGSTHGRWNRNAILGDRLLARH